MLPFAISEVNYLRLYQKNGTNNVIELHADLSGGKYGGVAQQYSKKTDYKYFKVSSIAYPIYDVKGNFFLQKDVWYPVLDSQIQLSFPTITFNNPTTLTNVIYADNAQLINSTEQVMKLFITVSNSPELVVKPGIQYLSLQSVWNVTPVNVSTFLQGFKNFALNIYNASGAGSTLTITKNELYYNPLTRAFAENASGMYFVNETATGVYKYGNIKKSEGVLVSPAKYTDTTGNLFYQVPEENLRLQAVMGTAGASISLTIAE